MDSRRFITRILGVGLCVLGSLSVTYALDRGTSGLGLPYVSGGVGSSEQVELSQERNSYNLWLTTVAKGSGAYLASVRVRILDKRTQQPVLEHTLDGPWLFVELPVGRYEIEAVYRESPERAQQMLKRSITVQPRSHRQMVLRFDTSDQSGSERDTPLKAGSRDDS